MNFRIIIWITLITGLIVASVSTIKYSPLWLFSKYRKLRPFIIAQYLFETGDGSSSLFKGCNNAFGMKVPQVRRTFAVGACGSGEFAKYLLPIFSLWDLFLWFRSTEFPADLNTIEEYVLALKIRGYFQESALFYRQGLMQYL